jgi:acetyl-CoA carboxylase carboxyl transferase subunit beta
MGWFDKLTRPRRDIPSDLWKKCPKCGEVLLIKDLAKNLYLCSKCDHHLRMPLWDRIALLSDDNSFVEVNREMRSVDPLQFVDTRSYGERLEESITKTDVNEAVTTGRAALAGQPITLGVMNFDFMGGSMGSVVGEKLAEILEIGAREKRAVIIVSASGGARMQEGIYSLMQMAKTSAAIKRLNNAGVPFVSIMTDPTTGGVSASFASLGDINIAEPGALIGFAGPRVIEQTIRQKLPEGFQRAEFLLEHGMIDSVVHRRVLKATVAKILRLLKD